MIIFLTITYMALLFLLIRLRVLPANKLVYASPVGFMILMFVFLFVPLQWGAPAGDVRTITYSVQIVPNVAGEVIEVVAEPNVPMNRGDVLFRIDPEPYEAALAVVKAQLKFAELRLEQSRELAKASAGRVFDVQQFEAEVERLKAQVRAADFNLAETVVRAPSDGYVTNVALRPGARVTNMPFAQAMAFIDTSELVLGAQIPQIYARNIERGQTAEVTFKYRPGEVYAAHVEAVLQATAQGQMSLSGFAPQAQQTAPGPFFVRLKLDDEEVERSLPAGAIGSVAIYTEAAQAAHIIRRVMLRMDAWLNYVNPF